jgi:hypothetical protein
MESMDVMYSFPGVLPTKTISDAGAIAEQEVASPIDSSKIKFLKVVFSVLIKVKGYVGRAFLSTSSTLINPFFFAQANGVAHGAPALLGSVPFSSRNLTISRCPQRKAIQRCFPQVSSSKIVKLCPLRISGTFTQ